MLSKVKKGIKKMIIKKTALLLLLLVFLSGNLNLNRINIDYSIEIRYLLFLAFVSITSIVLLNRRQKSLNTGLNSSTLIFLLAIFTYLLLVINSIFYTIDQSAVLGKSISMLFLVPLIIGILFIVCNMELREFFSFITVFFIIVGIVYATPIYLSVFLGADRGDVNLSGPNVATRILFFAACSSIYRFLLNKKTLYFILIILFLFSIVLVGSRGGLVGAFLTLLFLLAARRSFKARKNKIGITMNYKYLLFLPLGLGTLFLIYKPVKRVFMDRVIGTTFSNDTVYTAGRDIIYGDALKMIKEKPLFGYGIDSFTTYTGHVYPHNLLLEMMVEIGLIGAIIFGIFVFFSIIIIFKMRKSSLYILSGTPLYMIIVQMFSGEFYDFRYFFLWVIPFLHYGFTTQFESLNTHKEIGDFKKNTSKSLN